jgi:predicted Zn finger-like uncharacterized protein
MIRFNCPNCMKSFKASDDKAGSAVRCKECGQPFLVPGSPPAPVPVQFQAPVAKPFVPQQVLVSPPPPPLPSSDLWHYTMNGVQQPPTSEPALRQMLALGQLKPADMAWKPGMPSWVPAGNLFNAESPPPLPEPTTLHQRPVKEKRATIGVVLLVVLVLAIVLLVGNAVREAMNSMAESDKKKAAEPGIDQRIKEAAGGK